MAWEHHWGEQLARRLLLTLGADPAVVPSWSDEDFDSLYVVRIEAGANGERHVSFRHEQQNLDRLPETCGDGPARLPPTN